MPQPRMATVTFSFGLAATSSAASSEAGVEAAAAAAVARMESSRNRRRVMFDMGIPLILVVDYASILVFHLGGRLLFCFAQHSRQGDGGPLWRVLSFLAATAPHTPAARAARRPGDCPLRCQPECGSHRS